MMVKADVYIGIDCAGGSPPYTCAILDARQKMLALVQGDLDVVTGQLAHYGSVLVAVNAPSCLNQGLIKRPEMRARFFPNRRAGRMPNVRVIEMELTRMGCNAPRTPEKLEDCSPWIRSGFELYPLLQRAGCMPHPNPEYSRRWVEASSEVIFHLLLGHSVYPVRSLEGRLQRQTLLFERGLYIFDPMDCVEEITRHRLMHGKPLFENIYGAAQLSALAVAYMAWMIECRPQLITFMGDPLEEGRIYLPQIPSTLERPPFPRDVS